MTTLAEHMIVAGAENRPPMLVKSMYNSWQSRMFLYINGKKNDRMMIESIKNGPFVYPTIEEDVKIREKEYAELTEQEKLQDDCDVQATNILSSIPQQAHSSQPYLPTYEAPHQPQPYQHAFYTQLNHTPPLVPQNAYHTPLISQKQQVEFPQLDSGLVVLSFLLGDDPVACLNKAMAFMSTVMASSFPLTNNQLITSSNPRNQATIQDGRVTVQQVQGRQSQSFAGTENKGNAISSRGNNVAGQARAQGSGQELDEEQLVFLADPGVADAKAVLMANLSSYNSDVLSEMSNHVINWDKVNQETKNVNESLTAELERYKERVKTFEQRLNIDLSSREKFIDSQMDDMIWNSNALKKEIDSLKQTLSKHVKEKESSLNNQNAPEILEFFKINEWQAKLDAKDVSIAKLKQHIENLKGKNVVEKDATPNNAKVIAPRMFKLDLEPLSPKVLNNRDAHIDYLKHSQKQDDTLREIVEHARELRPLDSDLDSACKHVQRIQEVLVYVTATCPSLSMPSEKLVVVTALNKKKKVRFAKPTTSSRMKSSTSASRSQPSGNTNKNRISRPTSSNQKNKVEDHPRSVKSNSNKTNHVIEPVCNANVKHSMLNANSELVCATRNECMFVAIHDLCVLDLVNDVNVRSKSKSAKSSKKKKTWKPTGKVFTDIGYRWKPTGHTFTIDGNTCPLTRITSTKVVPVDPTP
ncbi:hypothetical protein Tco_0184620 [Tanacetum coccineum]